MKSFRRYVLGLLVAGLTAGLANTASALTTIDFEIFTDGQNINGLNLGGVTVTNPSGNVEIYDDRFGVSSRSGTKAIGSFTGSSSNNPMIFTFDAPVNFVELYAGDGGGDIDAWTFEVFDSVIGGTSLGLLASGSYNGDPYVGLAFNLAGILRAEAVWTGPSAGIGFDDLSFDPSPVSAVPLPAALPLLLSALVFMGLVGWRRNRPC